MEQSADIVAQGKRQGQFGTALVKALKRGDKKAIRALCALAASKPGGLDEMRAVLSGHLLGEVLEVAAIADGGAGPDDNEVNVKRDRLRCDVRLKAVEVMARELGAASNARGTAVQVNVGLDSILQAVQARREP